MFSHGFLKDLAGVWASHGKETMIKTAQDNPGVFFATCARLIGPEVKLTIEQSLPGNLSMEDWQTMKEVIEAVRQAPRQGDDLLRLAKPCLSMCLGR